MTCELPAVVVMLVVVVLLLLLLLLQLLPLASLLLIHVLLLLLLLLLLTTQTGVQATLDTAAAAVLAVKARLGLIPSAFAHDGTYSMH